MTNSDWQPSAELQDLIDDYLDGTIEALKLVELEQALRLDRRNLEHFIRYSQHHTDLALHARATKMSIRILASLPKAGNARRSIKILSALAASLLLFVGGFTWWYFQDPTKSQRQGMRATLIRAQNCQWASSSVTDKDWSVGSHLLIVRGIAEYQLSDGSKLCVEGPCDLEVQSSAELFLHHGKLTALVGAEAKDFTVATSTAKIIHQGTEFGVYASPQGETTVCVFQGSVRAECLGKRQLIKQNQTAQIDARGVELLDEFRPLEFVRTIMPQSKTTHVHKVNFTQAIPQTLIDRNNQGIGLTHRLPGTGKFLTDPDSNIQLVPADGILELTTTDSDLNRQYKLEQGEYIGIRLKDYGFTGTEDFEVSAKFLEIPTSKPIGQFGLYVGQSSENSIRGGVIARKDGDYSQFLVNNIDGRDHHLNSVGIHSPGNDLRIKLKRAAGNYTLTIENETTGATSSLGILSDHLGDADLFVGLFGTNTQSQEPQKIKIKEFRAKILDLE